ncbi:NAD-dependent epimerase/dehydratase family protein [Thalassotalea euphylliae]|uniref:NAD-dependent epimerase/dehydratase family protein n=1 Tax=Thalassotalea euphylliae TaxID=1655234 RepID=UPI0015F26C43|nr:SDR family oxidoreductase [Thalassotalea euphylliae]
MRVLVLGGAGYVGSCLVEKLLESKECSYVGVYDNFSTGSKHKISELRAKFSKKLVVFSADILDSYNLTKAMNQFETVIHLASCTRTTFNDDVPHLYEQINHWGTSSIVDSVLESSSIKKLFFLSSVAVYGTGNKMFDSRSPTESHNNYGRSKVKAEKQLERLSGKVDFHIARSGTIFGLRPSAKFNSFVNTVLFDSICNLKLNIFGSGEQKRPVVHVDLIVEHIIGFIFSGETEKCVNLVQYNLSINELVGLLMELFPELEYSRVSQDMECRTLSVLGDPRYVLRDIELVKRLLEQEVNVYS